MSRHILSIHQGKIREIEAFDAHFGYTYTMQTKFGNFLCFASICTHLCAISHTFKCNDENRILGK